MGDSVKPWIGPEGKHSASNPTFPHSVKRKEKLPGSCEWVLCEHMCSGHSGPHVRGSSFSVCPTAGRWRHQVQPSSFCTTVHIRKRMALLECVLPPKPLDSLGLFFSQQTPVWNVSFVLSIGFGALYQLPETKLHGADALVSCQQSRQMKCKAQGLGKRDKVLGRHGIKRLYSDIRCLP